MSEFKPLFYKVFPVMFVHFLVIIRVLIFNITALTNFLRPSYESVTKSGPFCRGTQTKKKTLYDNVSIIDPLYLYRAQPCITITDM